VVGCSDGFTSCYEVRACPAGIESGAGGEGSSEMPSAHGGVGEGGERATGVALAGDGPKLDAGAAGVGTDAGDDDDPVPACKAGYRDWFTSSFAAPDGPTLGTPDFPSLPWVNAGNLQLAAGRVTGAGRAYVSAGRDFVSGAWRLRFRARFSGSSQQVSAAFNASEAGLGGARVTLDSSGQLVLSARGAELGGARFEPLDPGVDWFVEALFHDSGANLAVSSLNYASEVGAKAHARFSTPEAWEQTSAGTIAVQLASASASVSSPLLDELSLAGCGSEPPEYEALLIDTFERADSTELGQAEHPPSTPWTSSGVAARILNGGLELKDLANATAPLVAPTKGLRIRTTVSLVHNYLWAIVSYNVSAGDYGVKVPGFWVWGPPDEGYVYTGISRAVENESKHPFGISPGIPYFVQLDRHDDVAVLAVRTGSFTGPIVTLKASSGLSSADDTGGYLTLGNEGGDGTRFEDIRFDTYPVH
jgi:hypothetical protein